ncbi:MAG TPA: hypothetical protein VF533_16550 [Solirubrobacteraceae bacterium]
MFSTPRWTIAAAAAVAAAVLVLVWWVLRAAAPGDASLSPRDMAIGVGLVVVIVVLGLLSPTIADPPAAEDTRDATEQIRTIGDEERELLRAQIRRLDALTEEIRGLRGELAAP